MSAEYNTYIIEHTDNVIKAYMWLKDHDIIKKDILDELKLHDLSKYSLYEYEAYDDYFYGTKTKAVKEAFNYAWLHHIHNNPHHWQYWVLINDEDGTIALEMPENYVYEMICDWWSFSHKVGKLSEIFNWYNSHKKNMILHENTRRLVEEILDKIKIELDKEEK